MEVGAKDAGELLVLEVVDVGELCRSKESQASQLWETKRKIELDSLQPLIAPIPNSNIPSLRSQHLTKVMNFNSSLIVVALTLSFLLDA